MGLSGVTICVPFYKNSLMLREQLRIFEEYSEAVQLTVVDDGSPEDAYAIIDQHASEALKRRIALYRIEVDIPWNRGGARNLAAREAKTEWVCQLDIDHVLPADCARRLLEFDANPKHWYRFERYRNGAADETRQKDKIPSSATFGKIHPHIDSYLVTRRMFWEAGGYDEDYSGCLGGGSPFLENLGKVAAPLLAPPGIHLHVYTRSANADASDNSLSRDRSEYAIRKKHKRATGKTKAENPIRFPWVKEELMYPKVAGEYETWRKIHKGYSIARFGDGEVKLMDKHVYTRELTPVPELAREMQEIAKHPHERCLIGIPTMDPKGSKYENWKRHKTRFCKYFKARPGMQYYSALITRPDCGDWMETREYYEVVAKTWRGKKRVAIVSEPDSKLLTCVGLTNPVFHVECPMYGAYAHIDRLERETVAIKPDIALLSCGPTATVLAHRLAVRGIQSIDIGSIGGFLLRWHKGAPKPESYATERENTA